MIKSFLKVLPLAAVVLFATSCSKDENSDEKKVEKQPDEKKIEKVTIPFSVRVNTGNSISELFTTKDGIVVSKFTVNFEDAEGTEGNEKQISMNITSDGNIEPTTLKLVKEGDNFVFKGDITLADGKTEEDFTNGFVMISGSFGTAGTEMKSSNESLAALMTSCSHSYSTTFRSNTTAPIDIDENYAYFEFKLANTQTKLKLNIGEYESSQIKDETDCRLIWIAVPNGTKVTGNLLKTMTVSGGMVYSVDRHDVVDMQLTGGVLWATCNLGASSPADYGKYYAWGEISTKNDYSWDTYAHGTSSSNLTKYNFSDGKTVLDSSDDPAYSEEGWRMPTQDELTTLKDLQTGAFNNGYNFGNEYGSVFLPAAGCRRYGSDPDDDGAVGYYWSSSLYIYTDNPYDAWYLYFLDGSADVYGGLRYRGQPIRPVRCMN